MSRSKKHHPIVGYALSKGQKSFRSQENRAKRKKVKDLLRINPESELPNEKEYGNEWCSPRDGKSYVKVDLNQYNKSFKK